MKPLSCGHAPRAFTFRREPDDGERWTVEVCSEDTEAARHALVMLRAHLVTIGPLPKLVQVETTKDA